LNPIDDPLKSDVTITFAIPARNEERHIRDAIASIHQQRLRFPYEVIVVDNGSADRTATVAMAAGARVVFEPRAGLAHARQAGFLAARGEYLIYIDADTRLTGDWADYVVGQFEADRTLVGISTAFDFHDGRFVDNMGNLVFQRVLCPMANALLRVTGRPEIMVGSAMAARTEALCQANGIDLDFQFYGEDTMFALRLGSQGNVRYLEHPRYETSARRFQDKGLVGISYRYFVVFALIQLGMLERAARLARQFQADDRLRRRPERPNANEPDFVSEEQLAG
jgi:glycosyltransferase involved in cell wall biosynthesis